ncbi:hypothetical protein SYNPS1DRAFT_20172 [Syncephalis pseudoplumigaleata]|uniref:YMC020W-like alpha/beta hydrolase domain-containing protein n=1 Tax=Syncephalis pseudoplumigaleata TaxID=1712513 RepID=A0A4P9YTA2_9FUNG|nr:hypothetical protein SYNPS1DRAFT_20172 [Syncephalis pseudoplumigaleata]|eukprot:RKP22361.1 hypothetical protein SYNPS1DRAFT_20172 [Syncephalis pseudoplumigaleata]
MEKAVRQFLYETHQVQLPADAVTLMPLNGEGKVQHRVEKLYATLMAPERAAWRAALSEADCVFVTTHSQGTPVSTMLLARLLREGIVRTHRQRVCMLAMAGISHGPFPFLKDNVVVRYVEADAARELFHFMDAERDVSVRYRNDMHTVLKQGVKVVCVGSMADQVVPLYSGIMHGFSHPSLLRAIYIDGVDYTGDFLTSLISFALRLRNHGIHDHGLIVYLSEAIAGSLYSGTQGHSTIYEELQVYALAVRWLLDAHPEPLRGGQPVEHPADPILTPFQADERLNPYYLPWIMRGLLEDSRLRKNKALLRDIEQLQRQFEQWEPVSRPMKELKFRLEPLRARL